MNDEGGNEAEIRTARATQTKAMADRDVDAAALFWAEDVTMRRALGQAVNGRSRISQLRFCLPAPNEIRLSIRGRP